jgi:peptide deformylase
MSVKKILLYTADKEALRKKSSPISRVDGKVRDLIRNLKDTLTAHPDGIGLAAPQINVHRRVVIVRLGTAGDGSNPLAPPIALVNPEIVEAGDERRDFDGCLSFPGLYAETTRPHHLRVTGLDEHGKSFERLFTGFDAVVVHHEIDHLEGILFVDRVERLEDLYHVQQNEAGGLVRVPLKTLET